ncbi:unnamed protein product [Durusdinium trenchii]|uniref:Uncharacterized protein n=1 Tax=Durusdinium trenchii TaxID=1381693 RepID=A0ABP0J8F2_9DINO
MWVTEFGTLKLAKELQYSKAAFPMLVTEFGMINVAQCQATPGESRPAGVRQSMTPPRLVTASLLEHIIMFTLKPHSHQHLQQFLHPRHFPHQPASDCLRQ